MPIYEYECGKCKKEMEIVHGITEKPRTKCPECGGKLKRLMSLNSFHLKGTGWYKTDYAKSGSDTGASNGKKPGKKETGVKAKSKEKKTSEKSNAAA